MYNDTLMHHFLQPSNVGEMEDADAVGRIGDPDCGDYMMCWVKISNERITAVTFQCHGCPAAIATGSIMTELALGLSLDEVPEKITEASISKALGGMPEEKVHCSNLGAGALHSAILQYRLQAKEDSPGYEATVIMNLHRHLTGLVELLGAEEDVVRAEARMLTSDEQEAHETDRSLITCLGRPRLIEASFRDHSGQVFSDQWRDWEGTLGELLKLSLEEPEERTIFFAALNAVTAHAGIARGTHICKCDQPRHCAIEAKFQIMKQHRGGPAVMLGWQRHLAGLIADFPGSRLVVSDEALIGRTIGELEAWGPERSEEATKRAGLLWLSDSVLIDGTIDTLLKHPADKIFYGVGSSGAAALLGWRRFCPFSS